MDFKLRTKIISLRAYFSCNVSFAADEHIAAASHENNFITSNGNKTGEKNSLSRYCYFLFY